MVPLRLLHLADLHIGKRVCDFPMLEDQRHALSQVLDLLRGGSVDALLVAGDLYDKSQPSSEAVALVDWFLSGVAATGVPAIVIPGNHDSAERVAYAGSLLARQGIHMAPAFDGNIEPVVLHDELGPVHVWPIPYLHPATIRHFLPDAKTDTYTDAFRSLVSSLPLDAGVRNVAVVHQFVTAAGCTVERSDSEVSVGGLDNVDASVFDPFDYVALGHIHRPQRVGRDTVRYAGSLLKYSLSEADYDKSMPLVTLGPKGEEPDIELVPVRPLHDLRRIRGPLDKLLSPEVVGAQDANDYLHVVLTDENVEVNAMARLRDAYPNVMSITYDNARTRAAGVRTDAADAPAEASPLELFSRFYEEQNGLPLSETQLKIVREELKGIEAM
ncbi:MAG: exonuclease SbcCD subunit D [Parafannyhessea sp.]|uniref:exonuclease SbcCD subunit D n=1 Tax=Parafannyhessea sp. TaxID=2847324 RepID=UPI003EFC3A84